MPASHPGAQPLFAYSSFPVPGYRHGFLGHTGFAAVTSSCLEVSLEIGRFVFVSCMHYLCIAVVSGGFLRALYAFVHRHPAMQVQQLREAKCLAGSGVDQSTEPIWVSPS